MRCPPTLLPLLLALLASGCGSCEEQPDPKVPFKLGHKPAQPSADAAPVEPRPVSEALGTSYAPPIDQPELDGVRIPLAIVRASLLLDLDADGDRDALLLADDAEKKLALSVAMRDGSTFAEPRVVPSFALPLAENCSIENVRVAALSANKGLAVVSTSCSEPEPTLATHHLLFSLESTPRAYQRISLPSQPDPTQVPQLAVESGDADGDGLDDVLLALTVPAGEGGTSDPLKLALLDRPSGLVRDAREPETTLSAWASAALGLVAKAPDQAVLRARQVQTVGRTLCRELGAPLVRIDGAQGLSCGDLTSQRDAALALVLGHAKQGQVGEAFEAYAALLREGKKPDAKQLKRAHEALRSLPAEKGVTLREGPKVERTRVPFVHLPQARFVDERTLLVRRRAPVLVALDSMAETPAPPEADDLMRDPGGQLAVTDIERSCAGHVLRIERQPAPVTDYLPAPPVSMALIAAFASPPGCTTLPESERRDRGGYRVLGWAPQGVVAARGAQLFVVPLNLEGKPSGEPRPLDHATPVPAPLPLGAALADGSVHAEATPFGVLLYAGAAVTLLRPDGYDAALSEPSDVALSPSGRQLAVLSGERVFLLTRSSSSAP